MSKKPIPPGKRVQLHRALSKLGWGSRTQAWEWIRAGQVMVDGRVVTDPLTWVDVDRQAITRGGTRRSLELVTLALHKPRGVVTTRRDELGRKTVYDLLPADLPWVFPAGRLDADSEGLLIVTSDSELSHRLTDPSHHVPRTYHVTVRGKLNEGALKRLRAGVELSDGLTRPARVRVFRTSASATVLEMILTEGKNRQIRRMVRAVDCRVRRLIRVAIGGYELGDLAPGSTRLLTADDLQKLTSLR